MSLGKPAQFTLVLSATLTRVIISVLRAWQSSTGINGVECVTRYTEAWLHEIMKQHLHSLGSFFNTLIQKCYTYCMQTFGWGCRLHQSGWPAPCRNWVLWCSSADWYTIAFLTGIKLVPITLNAKNSWSFHPCDLWGWLSQLAKHMVVLAISVIISK